MTSKQIVAVLAAAVILNTLPLMLTHTGGDIFFQMTLMDCFAGQFWQGDWRPQWCFSAEAGLGSPVLLFYFPLPFYIASIFYPLTWVGFSTYYIYVLCAIAATAVMAWASYRWLEDIVSPPIAVLATVIILFVPYRMEVLFFRNAYSELWALAFMPLLFLYARRIVQNRFGHVPYALVLATMFLTHAPCAVIALLFSGAYVVVMSGVQWSPKWRYVIAVLLALALAAFYLVPAFYYRGYISGEGVIGIGRSWVNTFVGVENIWPPGADVQTRPVIAMVLTILALIVLVVWLTRRRFDVPMAIVRQETYAWGLLFVLAFFLLTPVSKPLYAVTVPLSTFVFPWRMQIIFVLAAGYFSAVAMQWFLGARHKTWKMDYALLLAFLILVSHFLLTILGTPADVKPTVQRAPDVYKLPVEYRLLWPDAYHHSQAYFVDRSIHPQKFPRAQVIRGSGAVKVTRWAWDGIIMDVSTKRDAMVRVDHRYFPIWYALDEHNARLTITPEKATGLMLLDVPVGVRQITLQHSMSADKRALMWSGYGLSLAALFAVGLMTYRARRVHIF